MDAQPPQVSCRYNWTFPCHAPGLGQLDANRTHYIECPCGQFTCLLAPPYRGSFVVTCDSCKDWHTVLFEGDPSPEERVLDAMLEYRLALEEAGVTLPENP